MHGTARQMNGCKDNENDDSSETTSGMVNHYLILIERVGVDDA